MKEKIKESLKTYEKCAKIYADHTSQKLLQFQLNKFISLLPGKKVLDLGCGAGRDVEYFLEEGLEPTGIDICKPLIEEAKKTAPKANFQTSDILELNLKETFDGIWIMASLSDIQKKDALKLLKNCNNLLNQQGIIYIAVKEGEQEKILTKERYGNLPRFYAFYKKEELEALLKKAGFLIIEATTADDEGTRWIEIFAKKP